MQSFVLTLFASALPIIALSSEVPSPTMDLNLENVELDRHKINNGSAVLLSVLEKAFEGYSKEFPPATFGSPVEITVDVFLRGILDVSEVDMEIHVDLDLAFLWYDKRLTYEQPHFANKSWDSSIHRNLKERIWTPPLSLLNEKESVDHSQVFNRDNLRWYPDGLMYQNLGTVSKFPCKMSLQNFPHDTQICSVNIGSHGNTDKELKISWASGDHLDAEFINFVDDMSLIAYRGRERIRSGRDVNFTVLVFDLMFQRSVGYFVIGAYFPAALIVIISWLAFWMEHTAERLALGVTCLLTITTLLVSTVATFPRVSYIKAIDIYAGACFAIIFATLIYATAAGYKNWKRECSDDSRHDEGQTGRKQEPPAAFTPPFYIHRYDPWARIYFPIVFLSFNVLYWMYYLNQSKVDLSKTNWAVPEADARLIEEI